MKKYCFDIIVIMAFAVFIVCSFISGFGPGIEIFRGNFRSFVAELFMLLPLMFILLGLFDVWVPREKVEKHIGKDSGLKGSLIVSLLAFLQAGPLYAAFPVAYTLWKKGCSRFNIFLYLGAFSTMKIPMLMFEIGFLGVKFSLLRVSLTLPAVIAIAFILQFLYRNKPFDISNEAPPGRS
ncbi:MAG: permease [Bacteroidales bacterium]|nr:permease [Bacteroidales bacterium]